MVVTVQASGVYLQQPATKIQATVKLLQYFRAFLASDATLMRDPYSSWLDTLTREQARRKLRHLIHVAINRKAGIPDSEYYLTGVQVQEAARTARNLRHHTEGDKQPYYGWFTARQRRLMRHLLGTGAHLVKSLPKPTGSR